MAKKYFKDKVYNRKRNRITLIIIIICVIGIIGCFLFVTFLSKNKDISYKIREEINVEINGDYPNSEVLFTDLTGVKESDIDVNYDDVDITTLGEYTAEVKIAGNKHDIIVNIIDETKPSLELKEVNIAVGGTYSLEDFISKCSDNSKEECTLDFSKTSLDSNGNQIDYTSYSIEGSYDIKIDAKDSSGNVSTKTTKLIIGEVEDTEPVYCPHGNLEYNNEAILAIIVGVNNCAVDLDNYENDDVLVGINSIIDTETEKIKKDIDVLNDLVGNIKINRTVTPILNNDGVGFVGYSLYIEAFEGNGETIVKYYLNLDGERVFSENPHNLK